MGPANHSYTCTTIAACALALGVVGSVHAGESAPTGAPPIATAEREDVAKDGRATAHTAPHVSPAPDAISAFVRRIYQDTRGHYWFGTNGDGVCRFDGESLTYYSIPEGFGGVAVRGIVEDGDGNVWFATSGGVTRYDGEAFVNFTVADGLPHDDAWAILVDRAGTVWVGTYGGACRLDGERFVPFEIPPTDSDPARGVSSPTLVRSIMQDRAGNMWFATGGGAFRFDGEQVTNISEKDGLCDDSINCILEDRDGNIWFATHYDGVCRFDGESFVNLSVQEGLNGTEVWDLYQDPEGNIWFPVEQAGLYRYDGRSFTNYSAEEGLGSPAVQCTFWDRTGRLWAGGYLGLYRLHGGAFVQVSRDGPW